MGFRKSLLVGLFLLTVSPPVSAAVTVAVRDLDTGEGIVADVIQISAGPPARRLTIGTTDESGQTTNASANCAVGDTITAQPLSADYPPPATPRACNGSQIVLRIRSLDRIDRLAAFAIKAETHGQYAIAAQAFTEAQASKPDTKYESSAFQNVALALGVPKNKALVLDIDQDKLVPSQKLIDSVKKYQRAKGLPETGLVGHQTLEALAHGSVSENLAVIR